MTMPVPPVGEPLFWLGGNIDVRVEIDTGAGEGLGGLWDEGLWDQHLWGSDDPDWEDMTSYVIDVECHAGADRWGERFQAGGATIMVANTDGFFTPGLGLPDPFTREYRLGRRIRIVAIPDPDAHTVKVPLFTGRLDASYDAYVDATYGAVTALQCLDFMATWAAYNPLATTATGAQTTHARVGAALDRIEWPTTGRDIQTGDHNIQTSDLAQTTLEECQRAADAEGGAFFASPDGKATFKNRDWLTTDTRSTDIQGYVGYTTVPTGAQAAHYEDVRTSWELARVVNDVHFARDGGTMQEAEDEASQFAYGAGDGAQKTPRTYQRTDFHNTTDAEVLALAVRYLNSFKDARMRVDEVTIEAVDDPDNEDLNRLIWDTQLGDRLAIQVSPPFGWEFEREVHVMGVTHRINHDRWSVTLRLDDAQTIDFAYWQLQDPILSVLNVTTRVS